MYLEYSTKLDIYVKKHITPLERLQIGSSICSGLPYGAATQLAKDYSVSRWFIYDCKSIVSDFIERQFPKWTTACPKELGSTNYALVKQVVCLYLHCQSSLSGISACLGDLFSNSKSKGFVSGLLNQIGSLLPCIENIPRLRGSKDIKIGVLSDEVYINGLPVLAVMDSASHYILGLLLADSCDSDSWGYFWLSLTDLDSEQIQIAQVSCDLGSGLQKSLKDYLTKVDFQYDLFHYYRPLCGYLGRFSRRINKKWDDLLKREAELDKHVNSTALKVAKNLASECKQKANQLEKLETKTAHLKEKLEQKYEELDRLIDQDIALTEVFDAIRSSLQIIDKKGFINNYEQAKEDLLFFLEYAATISEQEGLQKVLKKLNTHVLLAIQYLKKIPKIHQQIKLKIKDRDLVEGLLILWDLDRAIRACKQHTVKQILKKQKDEWEQLISQGFVNHKQFEQIYLWVKDKMKMICRSSSMMENVNGRIRVFADAAKGQLNQNRLNLIRFFLNHKPLDRTDVGQRKLFSPYQIFMDKKEDNRHWFDILWQDYLDETITNK